MVAADRNQDQPPSRWLRLGSYSFPATLAVASVSVFGAVALIQSLSQLTGSDLVAIPLTLVILSGAVLIFKQYMFRYLFRTAPGDDDAALLEYLVQQNNSGLPGEEEMEMELLENALHLKQIRAHECMSPRNEIVHIDISASVEELRRLFVESSLSRILVNDGEIDKTLGYVHVQQMFSMPAAISEIVMPITFVPESIQVNDLLSKFIKNRTNIACVVDEYGSIAGLVTLEDVLEQLFGEIDDEHDSEEFIETRVAEREFLFSGRLEVDYLNEKYPELEIPTGDYNTLSGYIVTEAQGIPEQGARITLHGKIFQLEIVSDRKIETVRMIW